MSTVNVESYRERNGDTIQAGTKTVNMSMRSKDLGEELIPGIPNDVTLDLITSKVPWRDLHILSSVSPDWQKAIRSHLVYDARVRAHSTETVAVVVLSKYSANTIYRHILTMALYSMRDKSWEELPPIPKVRTGIPFYCECVSVKDKIYVLGGVKEVTYFSGSSKVYVLDLAGPRQWKRCANMQQRRLHFGCGVKDGKIFVFGGISLGKPVCGSEVYDPKIDAWCAIKPMTSMRYNHRVSILGEGLLVDGGLIFVPPDGVLIHDPPVYSSESSDDEEEDLLINLNEGSDDEAEDREMDLSDFFEFDEADFRDMDPNAFGEYRSLFDYTKKGSFSEIYDPAKDEWRLMEPFGPGSLLITEGKVHRLTRLGIFVHNIDRHSSTLLHSFPEFLHSSPQFGLRDSDQFGFCAALAVKDELLVTAGWYRGDIGFGLRLLQSKGFGSGNKEIAWEEVICFPSVPTRAVEPPFMCSIQL